MGACTIVLPPATRLTAHKIQTGGTEQNIPVDPPVRILSFRLPPPTLEVPASDDRRLADRLDIDDLLKHPWINSRIAFKSALVTLKELIQISNQWRQSSPPIECQGPAEKQLDRVCEAMAAVLPCCENYEEIVSIFSRLKGDRSVARDLAVDLGLDVEKVWTKLSEAIAMVTQKDKHH